MNCSIAVQSGFMMAGMLPQSAGDTTVTLPAFSRPTLTCDCVFVASARARVCVHAHMRVLKQRSKRLCSFALVARAGYLGGGFSTNTDSAYLHDEVHNE